ncbi:unnamed protein product [Adineta steineri]|uniref:SURP motif domain-containing protein n=1 Tax=Adineta steineri TaxID=433720 RepID=A0A815XKC3_9BILA|nr:unnamed protein product [Adineta steineri]CAF1558853.1 unnamed protein product [Adineta steineri]
MSNINLFPELDTDQGQEQEYNNGHNDYKEEELIVFGYSCKLFRDDFSAKAIDRGQSLIPWNGDENVMIDRYDCRGHLSDLTLWDSDLIRKKNLDNNNDQYLNEEEKRIEEECEQERYLELYRDIEKETLQQEEELKRFNAEKNAYNQVGFSYQELPKPNESSNKIAEETSPALDDDDEYEPFYPSEKLQIPYGMDIPESIKLNAVIEKTAGFVSTSGLQMEIVLKTKQANNPQFDFLKYDHYLNPYYRHLIIMIKSGKYRPNVDNNSNTNSQKKKSNKNGIDQNSSHDEDETGDSYLHPLLRGSTNSDNSNSIKKPDETLRKPAIPMNIHNTAYGQLIKKYEHLRREKAIKENDEEKMSPKLEDIKNDESSPRSETSSSTSVIPPPPDVKPIIDKLAEYVARNGSTFEQSIRTKNDPRFGFLERDHIHHNYYQLKVQLCAQELLRKKIEENQRLIDNNEQHIHGKGIKLVLKTNTEESLTPTSCREFYSDEDSNSMQQNEQDDNGEFIGPRPPSPEFLEKMRKQEERHDRASGFVRDKIVRDKQEERKRKVEMLLQQLKNKTNELPPSTTATPPPPLAITTESNEIKNNSNINPILVEKLLNVKNECSSSSLITSPRQYNRSKHSRSTSKSRHHSKYSRRSRSKSNHRRTRRSSHKRSRTRSKSRNHHRSKKSKTSKSSKSNRDHRRHRHRRHRYSSKSSSRSNSSSTSRSSSNSSYDKKKKRKLMNNDDEQRQNQEKKNPQSSKWDQREPIKIKNEPPSTDTPVSASSLSMNTEITLSNSTSSS